MPSPDFHRFARRGVLPTLAAVASGALFACATTQSPPTPEQLAQEKAQRLESDRRVAATLRSITARVKKGDAEAEKVRAEYRAQESGRPDDWRGKLFVAWTAAPSEAAWQEIHRLSKFVPEEPWLPTCAGLVYLQWKGFLDQADEQFQRALAVREGFLPARVGRADVLRLRGRFDEARAGYQAVLADAPDWEEALVGLGLAQIELRDPGAAQSLEKALQADRDDLVAIAALAKLKAEAGDAAAIELYGRMLEFDPRNRLARTERGRLMRQRGQLAPAAAEYEHALVIAGEAEISKALVGLYRELGQADQEQKALERHVELDPNDAEPMLRLAELRAAKGDVEGAEDALQLAAGRRPEDGTIHVKRAELYLKSDNLVAAIGAWRMASEKGAPGAAEELKKAQTRAGLPDKPLKGDVNRINQDLSRRLTRHYQQLQKTTENLAGGKIRAKVSISEEGQATKVELVEDTVHDPALAALVHWTLKDAIYPKERRTPTFVFELAAPAP